MAHIEAPVPHSSTQAERMSLKSRIEAVIYAAEEPVTLAQLAQLLAEDAAPLLEQEPAVEESQAVEPAPVEAQPEAPAPADTAEAASDDTAAAEKKAAREKDRKLREIIRLQVVELIADYANNERGMEIREVAGGYRMSTKPEYHDTIRAFVKSLKPPLKLSLQALETLAVIAYKQPVTAPDISEIRGVDTSGVLGSLISRKLITTAGRKQVIGRPILYKTTRDFLLRFGLKDISELPSIEEFEKLAGELSEVDDSADINSGEAAAEVSAADTTPLEIDAEESAEVEVATTEEPGVE